MNAARYEKAKWLWFADTMGYESHAAGTILERESDIDQLLRVLHDGRDEKRKAVLLDNVKITPERLREMRMMCPEDYFARLDQCDRCGIHVTTWGEEEYPRLLRQIPTPPPVLYYRGDISIPNQNFLFAVIGTRRPSAYGAQVTEKIAGGLAKVGIVLVSGLAAGLDGACHEAAVKANTPTVACLAFGVDLCYPAENGRLKEAIERQGLALSEYPPGTPPMRKNFLQRNRLIAGLSHGVCVAEARKRSGTMRTVEAAIAFDRDVFAVPGSIFSPMSEGTNQMLADGAHLVRNSEDILRFYQSELRQFLKGKQAEKPEKSPGASPEWEGTLWNGEPPDTAGAPNGLDVPDSAALSADAQALKKAMRAQEAVPVEVLCARTGIPFPRAAAAATELEMAGVVTKAANRYYQLKP